MPNKIVYQAPGAKPHTVGCTLVAGLEWRVLAAPTDTALREMARERAATHAVRIRLSKQTQAAPPAQRTRSLTAWLKQTAQAADERHVAGFYVNLDGAPPSTKTHSVAAAFAGWMAQHPVALLCYAITPGSSADQTTVYSPQAWLVVVVMAGMPVVDALVGTWDEAHALVAPFLEGHPDISVVSNDAVRYPQTIKADNILPALANYAQSEGAANTRITALPTDTRRLVVLTVVVALFVAGYLYYQKAAQEAARQRAIAERATKDPTALYVAALRAQGATLGLSRQTMINAYAQVAKLPLHTVGWHLQSAQCQSECTAVYTRRWGTTAELHIAVQALGPGFALRAQQGQDTDLDKAVVLVPITTQPEGIQPDALSHQDFIQGLSGTLLQRWKTAGLGVQIQAPQLWPQVAGVPSSFQSPQALATGHFEVSAIPLPLLKEVLGSAPAPVIWQGLYFEFSAGDALANPLGLARARATGVFYVRKP